MSSESLIDRLKNLDPKELLKVLSSCEGFCLDCSSLMHSRIDNLISEKLDVLSIPVHNSEVNGELFSPNGTHEHETSGRHKRFIESSPQSVSTKQMIKSQSRLEILLKDGLSDGIHSQSNGMSEDEKELIRISEVGRKKDFVYRENIRGKNINVLQGLELHTGVFNVEEQKKIVECVYEFQRLGQDGQLRRKTYSEPNKWMRGKGRVTIQFGCCYNYAVDKNGNPPGIMRNEDVDPMPSIFKKMIKRMVRWNVLPSSCVPNSCIVNIYDVGDCIPPHIDHHDFVRPFCTVSFLAECKILFGSNLKIVAPGEFAGPVSIPLPLGSVFILSGNGADVAKHCVPAVPARRISITFRRMEESKIPYQYRPDPELVGLKPMVVDKPSVGSSSVPVIVREHKEVKNFENDDFPPLGSSSGRRNHRNGWRPA
ncbi:RNA demethylase ALKBH9B-like [Impatiens glandulifera]|uniref:RNA demethylase ALKBH9B-like n=1 Tax=Impatiens glandulifera TaxID=253017 RepID=UPI001FB085B9|nr:RNA demethylase ALKBH9B-like [Impatiens glandulifera]